jgi:hypothetical protein
MAKRLVAKTGTYNKDGQDKGEYTKIGVILSNNSGEYMLLDPCVSIAGVLAKQNALAAKEGKPVRDSVMISIFEDEQNGQGGQQQQNSQQQAPQQNNQQQQAPAYNQQQAPQQQQQQAPSYGNPPPNHQQQ